MTFLAPIGALALLAIPAIVLLYFLKVRRPEFRVGALLFWRPYVADRQANAPWQRLRWSLLLLLQLLIAAALAFALLRPGIQGVAGVGTTTVVMIDGSASMQATDVSPTRFAAGVAKARSLAGQLGPGQRMAIVVAGEHASLLAPPSSDPAVLGAALDRARPSATQADLGEAFSLATAVLAGQTGGSVVLIGDGHAKPPPTPPRVPGQLIFSPVGVTGENAGIEAISKTGGGVFVRVGNYGRSDRDLRVEFRADGRLTDVLPLHVAANSSSDLTWSALPSSAGVVEARLTPGDAFALDDTAWLVTAAPAAHRVLLVSDGNGFLDRALKLRPGLQLTVQKPAEYKSGQNFDLYVFDGFVPSGKLPDPALVVGPPQGLGPVSAGPSISPGLVLPPQPRDPITQDVVLRDVHVQSAAKVAAPSGWRVAIAAADDPLLLVHEGEPRLAELTFDIHHSDLPLRAAFPILVQNLLDYLLPGGFENQSYPAGRPIQLAGEQGVKAIQVSNPSGRTVKIAPPFPPTPFTDTGTPGIYTVREELPGSVRTARFVVLFQDSNLSRIQPGGPPLTEEASGPAGPVARGTLEIWPWLAALALALLVVEWLAFHRGTLRWSFR